MSPSAVSLILQGYKGRIVHVTSYVQRAFTEHSAQARNPGATRETDHVSAHIAGAVHSLHAVGVPTYVLRSTQQQFNAESGALHRVALDPAQGDRIIDSPHLPSDTYTSPFNTTALAQCMTQDGKSLMLIDGFYTHAAIFNLAAGLAMAGGSGFILGDLCADGRYPEGPGQQEAATAYTTKKLKRAREMGIGITRIADVTAALSRR